MPIWHLTFATSNRFVLFPDRLREAVRMLVDRAGSALLAFCLVDDHGHVGLSAEEARMLCVRRALTLGFRTLSPEVVDLPHVRPVTTRSHLENLYGYCLGQVGHHGLDVDPALWAGSCFPDLVGARCLVVLLPRARQVLPRFDLRDVAYAVQLGHRDIGPLELAAARRLGAFRVWQAAAFAVGAPSEPGHADSASNLARAAATRVAADAGIAREELLEAMQCTSRTWYRLRGTPPDPTHARAVLVRLACEELAASRRLVAPAKAPPRFRREGGRAIEPDPTRSLANARGAGR